MFNKKLIMNDLKNNLSPKRYKHSLLVGKYAKKLAKKYNIDEETAYLTGITHDIAKEFSEEKTNYYKEKYNIKNDNYKTIHADIGSFYVKEKYNFTEDMAEAIRYHTRGGLNMSMLDKIILVSDKIGRKNLTEEGKKLKKLAFENIDLALLKYLESLKEKLESNGKIPDKVTLLLIDNLKKQTNNF